MMKAIRSAIMAAGLLMGAFPIAPASAVALGYYQDPYKVFRPLTGVVLMNPDGTLATVGGGGSGGAVTIANGADTTEGNTADAAYSDATGAAAGTLSGLSKGEYVTLSQIKTILNTPMQQTGGTVGLVAGTANIGSVSITAASSSNGAGVVLDNSDGQAAASVTGSLRAASRNFVFNGSTWDRERGDIVGGQWVQEKERSSYFAETTTALAASATYTGSWHDAGVSPSQWASFTCAAITNQPSGTNGFYIQFSPDQTTLFTVIQATLASNVPTTLTAKILSRYARCIETNGTTAQVNNIVLSQFSGS